MISTSVQEKPVKIDSFQGIDVYHINAEKFKTNTVNIFFTDNLSKEKAAKNALLPAVLRRGCERLKTSRDIALYLEGLYGANFDCGVVKKGELQMAQFYIEFVADRFTGENDQLFEKTMAFLFEILYKPLLVEGAFKAEYVEQEKENLKRLIESKVNDKMQYAMDRCFEEMCKEEPFGVCEYGDVEDVEALDASALLEHYRYFTETLPMQVYITGNISEKNLQRVKDMIRSIKRGEIKQVGLQPVEKHVSKVRETTEKLNVNQGKLSLGFRTNIGPSSPEYYNLIVYNGILGGGMHSKLFQNVREKASLAYYAFSRLEKFKGLMLVSCGIESENREKAIQIIREQIQDIREGKISEYEFESTIKTIETGIKSLKDSQLNIVDYYLSQTYTGIQDTFDSFIEKISKVTRENVVAAAKKVELDTVYFLTSVGSEAE